MAQNNLDSLLRQAEMKEMQLRLNQQFHRNMVLFQKSVPTLFEHFVNYRPQQYRLSYSADNYLTLVEAANNNSIYDTDPVEFTDQQLRTFRAEPLCLRLNFLQSTVANDDYIHAPLVNELLESYEALAIEETVTLDVPIGFLAIAGTGVGYHIADLVQKHDIHNLMIIEPNLDLFYAALHTIDWAPIIQKQTQPSRTLKFCIGYSVDDTFNAIKQLPDEIGLHNLSNTFFYQHLYSPQLNAARETLISGFHQLGHGVGFFDDEQVSVSHTLTNLSNGINLLKPSAPNSRDLPAILIGNGPSLDTLLDDIRAIRNKVYLFSCGTALGALYKAGIQPDYHVEMERTLNIKDWIESGSTPEFRKAITLLTLNTCPPAVAALFDNVIFAKKPNDAGTTLLNSIHPDTSHLHNCNPTVSNAALAYIIAMGFTEIHLAGVDLGMQDVDSHHSRHSLYSTWEQELLDLVPHQPPWFKKFTQTKQRQDRTDRNAIRLAGNKRKTIFSNPVLDSCRTSIEQLLQNNPHVTCYNPNDGAQIRGTVTSDGLPVSINTNKKSIPTNDIANYLISDASSQTEQLKRIGNDKTLAGIRSDLESAGFTLDNANQLFSSLSATDNPITKKLFKGSLNAFLGIISKYIAFAPHHMQQVISKQGFTALKQLLDQSEALLITNPLRADKTRNLIAEALAQEPKSEETLTASISPVLDYEEFNTQGYCGPFDLDAPDNAVAALEIVKATEDYNCLLNNHNYEPILKNLSTDNQLVTVLQEFCHNCRHIWGSNVSWSYNPAPVQDWTHNKSFQNASGVDIDYSEIKSHYMVLVALSDVTLDNGAIECIPGSHCDTSLSRTALCTYKNPELRYAALQQEPANEHRKALCMKKGQFLIIHSALLIRCLPYKPGQPPAVTYNFCTTTDKKNCPPDLKGL